MTPQLSVSACLFDTAGRVLLVKRRNEPYAGRWSLPGGRVEAGETLVQAVAREVVEETGILAGAPTFFHYLETIDEAQHFLIMVFFGTLDGPAEAGGDAAACALMDTEALADLARNGAVTPGLAEIVTMAQQRFRDAGDTLASDRR